MSFTNTGGGDHEGANWTPADTTVIGGVHYNIATFLVTTGYTLHLEDDNELEIYADIITVTGDIDGDGHSNSGSGNGGAGGADSAGAGGGGGAGYGAAGGAGGAGTFGAGGSAGSAYGTIDTTIISLGSKGGNGGINSTHQGLGGNGGGSIYLSANTVTVTGTINLNGVNGTTYNSGGGGGSGGGILIVGGAVTVSGTCNVTGGNGGSTTNVEGDGGGGGGAGGRIKILYRTLNIVGATWGIIAGAKGTSSHASDGVIGNAGNATNTEVKCNSTYAMGQTFTPDTAITGKFYLSQIRLWAMAVSVSGKVFTLTVYDDSGKGVNYGSTTLTISSTGEKNFDFEPWIELPDASDQYYFEVTTPDGDVDFGTEGNEPLLGEDMYFKVVLVERFSMYTRVFGLIPVDSPSVYNTADTTVKSNVANLMLAGAIHKVLVDGTGTFQYSDDFSTGKFGQGTTIAGTVTYDAINDEVDIAVSSSMYWKCDTKYPPTGVPTLTARINVTAGTPTIKIAADSGGSPDTWYDIDTAIVDDVLTVYDLDNAANLHLKNTGTPFYVKIDCPAGVTLSMKSIQLDSDFVTIDVEHPKIPSNGVSTVRCDQDADSGMNCTVELIFRDRSWAV